MRRSHFSRVFALISGRCKVGHAAVALAITEGVAEGLGPVLALVRAGGANQALEMVVVTWPPGHRHSSAVQQDNARVLDAQKVLSIALQVQLGGDIRFAVGMGAAGCCRDLELEEKDGLASAAIKERHVRDYLLVVVN
jgi:hypothetical protein